MDRVGYRGVGCQGRGSEKKLISPDGYGREGPTALFTRMEVASRLGKTLGEMADMSYSELTHWIAFFNVRASVMEK